MRTITITIDDGKIEVWEDGKTTGQLCWDEMLGQLAEMTHPRLLQGRYPLMTQAEWDARWKRSYEGKPLGAEAEKTGEQNVNSGNSVSKAGT